VLCRPVGGYQRLGGPYHLHLQGRTSTRRRNPEDHSRHLHHRENLKSQTPGCLWHVVGLEKFAHCREIAVDQPNEGKFRIWVEFLFYF
jgi:hypothetical protein